MANKLLVKIKAKAKELSLIFLIIKDIFFGK